MLAVFIIGVVLGIIVGFKFGTMTALVNLSRAEIRQRRDLMRPRRR